MPSVPDETFAACWSVPSGFNDIVEERVAFVDVRSNHHHTFKQKELIVQGYRMRGNRGLHLLPEGLTSTLKRLSGVTIP